MFSNRLRRGKDIELPYDMKPGASSGLQYSLNSVLSGTRLSPPRILIYGIEGIGKSTFANGFPNPIFISTEDGLDGIDCKSLPLCKTIDDVFGWLDALIYQKHSYQTVVVDTIDWASRLITDRVCEENGVTALEKIPYGKGQGFKEPYWRLLIQRLSRLRSEKGMSVVLNAHAKCETVKSLETVQYKRLAPRLASGDLAMFSEWLDYTFLATREMGAALGEDGGERILCCTQTQINVGKKRYEIPARLPMDANVVLTAIRNAYLAKKKEEQGDENDVETKSGAGKEETGETD